MGALAQYAVFAAAGSLAVGVIVTSIRPEVERIRAVLRWREHDRRAGLARQAGEVRP